jgi:hypothetical protein
VGVDVGTADDLFALGKLGVGVLVGVSVGVPVGSAVGTSVGVKLVGSLVFPFGVGILVGARVGMPVVGMAVEVTDTGDLDPGWAVGLAVTTARAVVGTAVVIFFLNNGISFGARVGIFPHSPPMA